MRALGVGGAGSAGEGVVNYQILGVGRGTSLFRMLTCLCGKGLAFPPFGVASLQMH